MTVRFSGRSMKYCWAAGWNKHQECYYFLIVAQISSLDIFIFWREKKIENILKFFNKMFKTCIACGAWRRLTELPPVMNKFKWWSFVRFLILMTIVMIIAIFVIYILYLFLCLFWVPACGKLWKLMAFKQVVFEHNYDRYGDNCKILTMCMWNPHCGSSCVVFYLWNKW